VSTIVARVTAAPKGTRWSLWGLAVGVLGLVIQWIADPGKFNPFPPGIVFIVAFGALVVFTTRHWWAPVFSVLISLWIIVGGWAAGKVTPNLRSGDAGTVAGNVVMLLGLAFAAITGIAAILGGWQARAR
jgi:hypothetical protein